MAARTLVELLELLTISVADVALEIAQHAAWVLLPKQTLASGATVLAVGLLIIGASLGWIR